MSRRLKIANMTDLEQLTRMQSHCCICFFLLEAKSITLFFIWPVGDDFQKISNYQLFKANIAPYTLKGRWNIQAVLFDSVQVIFRCFIVFQISRIAGQFDDLALIYFSTTTHAATISAN